MKRSVRLGVIVPSSNTSVEPITTAIVSSIHDENLDVTVHFSRFRVTKLDLSEEANSQFLPEKILAAASLLADANVDVIGWSGTSAGWLGFEIDENLCKVIQEATGIPATTSTLAFNQLLRQAGEHKLGMVTPYVKEVNEAIRKNYRSIGFDIAEERFQTLEITKNADIARVTEAQLGKMISQVVDQGSDVVAVFCTNFRAAQRVAYWEKTYGKLILDTVATPIWGMLKLLDISPSCIQGWGKMFDM